MNEEQCRPEDFHVQIGMALSQQKFEVDADVYEKFHSLGYAEEFMYYNAETKKYHIDNQQTVKKQCELAGIPVNQIQIDETCTFLSPDGFSYRQDKQVGRHLSFYYAKITAKTLLIEWVFAVIFKVPVLIMDVSTWTFTSNFLISSLVFSMSIFHDDTF